VSSIVPLLAHLAIASTPFPFAVLGRAFPSRRAISGAVNRRACARARARAQVLPIIVQLAGRLETSLRLSASSYAAYLALTFADRVQLSSNLKPADTDPAASFPERDETTVFLTHPMHPLVYNSRLEAILAFRGGLSTRSALRSATSHRLPISRFL